MEVASNESTSNKPIKTPPKERKTITMSKRKDLKAAWRGIRANQAKQEMSKVNHLGVMNSKNYSHLFY
jgi:hypothetical protein